MLQQVAEKINILDDIEQRQVLASCISILARLRFQESLINSLFQEDIIKGSVIYESLLQKGEQKGELKRDRDIKPYLAIFHVMAITCLINPLYLFPSGIYNNLISYPLDFGIRL